VPELLWDSSALVKRYSFETGSDTVDVMFATSPAMSMATTYLVYAETCATLRRKLNRGDIDTAAFTAARSLLRLELLIQPGVTLLSLDDEAILGGIELADQHSLNASDAAMLFAYLRHMRARSREEPAVVLVTADQRLVRAADAEGLRTLNPEYLAAADVPARLASA
jgi:predicted nucleic acid-binding protein